MNQQNRQVELLAPAGDFACLRAAVESGADAVYLGGNRFGARAYANNFDNDTLREAVRFAHIRGVKIYVTVNILLHDEELNDALDYAAFLYEIGVDALIVQDVGMFALLRQQLPALPLHCSTQMAIHSVDGARWMEKMGAKMIVLAREMPIEEVQQVVDAVNIPVEVFVHGALCVSYSGQCLMSSFIGGRSGNRGMCAQPCRKKYTLVDRGSGRLIGKVGTHYLMSTKDLNTVDHLEEIVAAGVGSLKIEGRMKKPEYVATVVEAYQKRLDEIFSQCKKAFDRNAVQYELKAVFNREFTDGYLFHRHNGEITSIARPDNRGILIGEVIGQSGNMVEIRVSNGFVCDGDGIEVYESAEQSKGFLINGMKIGQTQVEKARTGQVFRTFCRQTVPIGGKVYKSMDHSLNERAMTEYAAANRKKIWIDGDVWIHQGKVPKLTVQVRPGQGRAAVTLTVFGEAPVAVAKYKTLESSVVLQQLQKTGDTPYVFGKIAVDLEEGCFLSVKELNELRRAARNALNETAAMERPKPKTAAVAWSTYPHVPGGEIIAGVRTSANAGAAIKAGADTIYALDWNTAEAVREVCKAGNVPCYFVLPNILHDREETLVEPLWRRAAFDGVVISNVGQLALVKRHGIDHVRGNHTLNVMNTHACDFFGTYCERVTLSLECNLKECRGIAERSEVETEVLAYGYLPVMTTEYCPISLVEGAKGCGRLCESNDFALLDERGKLFPIVRQLDCRSQILNSDVLFLGEKVRKVKRLPVKAMRMDFYFETPEEVCGLIRLYRDWDHSIEEYESLVEKIRAKGFTGGHFFRGV